MWTLAAIVCAMTAAAVFMRPAIARLLIYVLSALYVGYWLEPDSPCEHQGVGKMFFCGVVTYAASCAWIVL